MSRARTLDGIRGKQTDRVDAQPVDVGRADGVPAAHRDAHGVASTSDSRIPSPPSATLAFAVTSW
jgi:hypothetical protein